MKPILAATLLAGVAFAPVSGAAASFDFFGTLTLTADLAAAQGDVAALDVDISPAGDSAFFTDGNASAAASFDGVVNIPTIELLVSGSGDALGRPFGAADAFAFSDIFVFLFNETNDDILLPFTLSWDLSVFSTGLTPVGAADAQLGAFAAFDDAVFEILLDETLTSANGGAFALMGAQSFDVLVRAQDFASIELALDGEGFATSVAPVPLPAGLPLLAAGLGALALLRRRAA
jgi:hypothetical protein